MKTHYYFYKKGATEESKAVIVDDKYDLNKLNLKEGDIYLIDDVEKFKQLLTKDRIDDFERLNFKKGNYKVTSIQICTFGEMKYEAVTLEEI